MRMFLLITLLAVGCARSGSRQDNSVAATAGGEGKDGEGKDGEKLVCRRERVTGSNMRKRVCHYESDLRKSREGAQELMRRSNTTDPLASPEGGGGN